MVTFRLKEMDQLGYVVDDEGNKHYIFTDEAVYWRMKRGYKSAEDKAALTYDLMHVFAQPQAFRLRFNRWNETEGLSLFLYSTRTPNMLLSSVLFHCIRSTHFWIGAIAKFLENPQKQT